MDEENVAQAEEMVQQLRVLVALPEDLGLIPVAHKVGSDFLTSLGTSHASDVQT